MGEFQGECGEQLMNELVIPYLVLVSGITLACIHFLSTRVCAWYMGRRKTIALMVVIML